MSRPFLIGRGNRDARPDRLSPRSLSFTHAHTLSATMWTAQSSLSRKPGSLRTLLSNFFHQSSKAFIGTTSTWPA